MSAEYVYWFHDWTFVQGTPKEGWEKVRQPGVNFDLDAWKDLDKFCTSKPVPNQSEAVLYADFETNGEGELLVGLSCNWRMEAYCDGKLFFSTYETGNGQTYTFPTNHRVPFNVPAGKHLLAIRVQRGAENWNFSLGYVLKDVPPEPELEHGPWLTNPDTGAMTIAFTCNSPMAGAVAYRKYGDQEWTTRWNSRQAQCLRRKYHAIRIEGLVPGETYEYKILTIHPDNFLEVQLGETHSFKAPDAKCEKYSFFFTADLQFTLDRQHEIFAKMLDASDAKSCDFFVLAGDVNSAFLPDDVIAGPFAQLCEYNAAEKPILYVRGNHEMRGDYGDQFLDYFSTANGTTYDLLRLGDTAFLLLDSWEDKDAKTPGHTYCQWNLDKEFYAMETEWLKSALQSPKWTEAKRRIVICHGAAYSHHSTYASIPIFLQELTDCYFEGDTPQFNLNMWLTGHVHQYLRSVPGTDEIVSEEPPAKPAKGGRTYKYPVLTVAGPSRKRLQASCFRIDADADGFNVRSYGDTGELIEDLRYDNDGTCTERKSLTHYEA